MNYVYIVYHPVNKSIFECFNDINEALRYANHTYRTASTIKTHRLWSRFEIINEDDSDILYGM
jgi:hypothetical protein